MAKQNRIVYPVAAIVTILLGIGIRRLLHGPISKILGDVLYATMVYWIVRALLPAKRPSHAGLIAVAMCFAIEFLKLWHLRRLDAFRATTAGHLIFGSVFSYENLACYVAGAALAWAIDRYVIFGPPPKRSHR